MVLLTSIETIILYLKIMPEKLSSSVIGLISTLLHVSMGLRLPRNFSKAIL